MPLLSESHNFFSEICMESHNFFSEICMESHNFFSEMCMESHNFDDMLVLPAKSRHGRVFLPESIYRRMLRISRIFRWLPRCDCPITLRLKDATTLTVGRDLRQPRLHNPAGRICHVCLSNINKKTETRLGTSLHLSDGNCKFPSHGFRMAYSEER